MNTAPDPKDVQEFQFKQASTSQLFDAFVSIPVACNLLAADKKRGLLYAAQNNKIIVLKPGVGNEPEWKIELNISANVSKLMLNCDCSYLAVIPHGCSVFIYDAQALAKCNIELLYEIKIPSNRADVFINDFRWNPSAPKVLCTVSTDYTIGSFELKQKKVIEIKGLKEVENVDVLCAAWSPKGKQIVVGCKSGSIVQLKPDLKMARIIPGPTPYIGGVVNILWISNYQFCAAYLGSEQRINVLIVDAPKGETSAIFTCYEDITYGVSDADLEATVLRYYFDHVPEWGLILAASSSSGEVAVLGSTDGGATWNQWQLVDNGRAELPLVHTTESYPVGLAIDKSPSQKLPWGADSFLPQPVPILHVLATSGQLCSFHMVNLIPNCPDITCPPTEIVSPPPQTRLDTGLADTTIVISDLVTSTPRPKQLENIPDRPKPATTGNIIGKFYKTPGMFAQPPLAEKPKQQEPQKLVPATMEVKVEPPKETPVTEEPVKAKVKMIPVKEPIPPAIIEQKALIEDDSRDIRAYIEEHNLFEKELRNRLDPRTWDCGTEEERSKLLEVSHSIDQFLRELRETTNSLSSDIAYLKALLLQSFAWVEETKSKNAANNDIMTRSCGDSNKISDLQKLYYYTQTQLTQASKILDLEWSNRKSQEMSRMKIPHLEFVYQNLIMHHNIIQKEKDKLEKLKKQKWKLLTRNNNILGLNRTLSNLNISSSKSSGSLSRNTRIIEARCKTIASKTLSFTQGKQIKLKEHLAASKPRIIKPVNPSPIQHRLEATLSSLASANISSDATVEVKSKVEEHVPKQPLVAKKAIEKPKQQNPLASLNSFVAGIGTHEANTTSAQSKTSIKQPVSNVAFQPPAGNKLQMEKKLVQPVTTAISQTTKPKQDTITFSQVNTPVYSLHNLMKSFPKVDSILFETPTQKSENTSVQKPALKESSAKPSKETVAGNDSFKTETNLFATSTLKNVLSTDTSADKSQRIPTNTALKFGMTTAAITPAKTESITTFSFATSNISGATAKSTSQDACNTSQTTSAQTFSFASKPSGNTSPFSLKITPTTTAPQAQALNLSGLFTKLATTNQTSNVSSNSLNYKPTFETAILQTSLGQISVTSATAAPTKETVTTTPSVTIEKVSSTDSKISTFPTSSMQVPPATSATPPFEASLPTSGISVFGEMPRSTPTTASSFAVTTSAFGTPTTVSSTSIVSIFDTTSTTGTTTTTVAAATTTMSTFYSTLSMPTFVVAPTNLSTTSTTSAPSTLTFSSVPSTTTSATNVFGKPTLTMNAQFPSTPAVSTTTNAFDKPNTSPTSMPFGSSANTNIFDSTPTTSTRTSIFSGNNSGSIFASTTPASSPSSIFGGTASMNAFGTPQKSIFDNNGQKTGSVFGGNATNTGSTSFFDGATNNTNQAGSPLGTTNIFGGGVASNTPTMGLEQPVLGSQPAFGQAAVFDSKPVFGSQPTFGAKPIFGRSFGMMSFGASVAPPAFGSPPAMEGNAVPIDNNMPNVFGSVGGGNNTFESLGNQSDGLSFSSLAQKSPEAQEPPVFSSGSSFSSWR